MVLCPLFDADTRRSQRGLQETNMDIIQWIEFAIYIVSGILAVLATAFGWKWYSKARFEKIAESLRTVAIEIVEGLQKNRKNEVVTTTITRDVAAVRLAMKEPKAAKLTDAQRKVIIERALSEVK